MNKDKNKEKDLDNKLDNFLDPQQEQECEGEECLIKTDKSLVERMNKKIVTDDGRELLM
jgi:hypothetical protein